MLKKTQYILLTFLKYHECTRFYKNIIYYYLYSPDDALIELNISCFFKLPSCLNVLLPQIFSGFLGGNYFFLLTYVIKDNIFLSIHNNNCPLRCMRVSPSPSFSRAPSEAPPASAGFSTTRFFIKLLTLSPAFLLDDPDALSVLREHLLWSSYHWGLLLSVCVRIS